MMIDGIGSLLPHIRDGKVRALAVTGTARSPDLPDVPTMIESGYPDYLLSFWTGVLAPAGTPPDWSARAQSAINEGLRAESEESLAKFNVEPNIASPAGVRRFPRRRGAQVVGDHQLTNIKVE